MKKAFHNLKNIGLVTLLGVAALFGISSVVINNQVEETLVVEKAEATNTPVSATYVFLDASPISSANWVDGDSGRGAVMEMFWASSEAASDALDGYASLSDIPSTGAFPGAQSYEVTAADNKIRLQMMKQEDYKYYVTIPWFIKRFTAMFDTTGSSRHWIKKFGEGDAFQESATLGDNINVTVSGGYEWKSDGSIYTWVHEYSKTTGYTIPHYGIRSGDHLYIDVSKCPGWVEKTPSDNRYITIFGTATSTNATYIHLWKDGGADIKRAFHDFGAWCYNNEASQGVYAFNVDLNTYNKMQIYVNYDYGDHYSAVYSLSSSDKYKGFYWKSEGGALGTWTVTTYDTTSKIGVFFGNAGGHLDIDGGSWGSYRNNNTYSFCYAWKVNGSGNNYLYEVLAPQVDSSDVTWNRIIVARCNNSSSTPSWSNKLHEKNSIYFNSSTHDYNKIEIDGWNAANYIMSSTISNTTRAGYYGTYFNNSIVCSGAGSFTGNWTNVQTEYNRYLSDSVQFLIWEAEEDPEGSTLEVAMSKYDYIIWKYGTSKYTDFIGRSTGEEKSPGWHHAPNISNPFLLALNGEDNLSLIIIIIASSLSLISITALSVLVVKKHKRKEE